MKVITGAVTLKDLTLSIPCELTIKVDKKGFVTWTGIIGEVSFGRQTVTMPSDNIPQ